MPVCQFLNFENRAIIKEDILKSVKQSHILFFYQNWPIKFGFAMEIHCKIPTFSSTVDILLMLHPQHGRG